MKKCFFIPACVLAAAAIGFVINALVLNCVALFLNAVQRKKNRKDAGI